MVKAPEHRVAAPRALRFEGEGAVEPVGVVGTDDFIEVVRGAVRAGKRGAVEEKDGLGGVAVVLGEMQGGGGAENAGAENEVGTSFGSHAELSGLGGVL